MRTSDFDYALPPDLIAQSPAPQRDQSRLLVLHRQGGRIEHRGFGDLPGYLRPGDVLVLNDSRVIPARLRGVKPGTGGQIEVLLVEELAVNEWWVMLRPGKRVRRGTPVAIRRLDGSPSPLTAEVLEKNAEGLCRLRFSGAPDIKHALDGVGEVPLPPYIERRAPPGPEDHLRYQTVFAGPAGSVAAPTAGLHFTEALLATLRRGGVEVRFLTLHVGLGTFAPVKVGELAAHRMHRESYVLRDADAEAIAAARCEGRRVVAVGTTSLRVLESVAAAHGGRLPPGAGQTSLFIHPPYRFRVVDALLTNFHLPCSTLLMLVSAFAAPGQVQGRELVLGAYAAAIRERYRFFSYGEAMLIL